jgi:hypothetical protein
MGRDGVCVGAFDVDLGKSIRLLDSAGINQASQFSLDIGDVAVAHYLEKPNISAPHTEDVKLLSFEPCESQDLILALFAQKVRRVHGSIADCFDGKLYQPDHGALAMHNNNVSDHSVCFWKTDEDLTLNRYGKYVYRYGSRNIQIKYVGIPEAIDIIKAGSTVRLSLSRRWNVNGQEPVCWLQLSGWF